MNPGMWQASELAGFSTFSDEGYILPCGDMMGRNNAEDR